MKKHIIKIISAFLIIALLAEQAIAKAGLTLSYQGKTDSSALRPAATAVSKGDVAPWDQVPDSFQQAKGYFEQKDYENAVKAIAKILEARPEPTFLRGLENELDIDELADLIIKVLPAASRYSISLFKEQVEMRIFMLEYYLAREKLTEAGDCLRDLYEWCFIYDHTMEPEIPAHTTAGDLIYKFIKAEEDIDSERAQIYREFISKRFLILIKNYFEEENFTETLQILQDYYVLNPSEVGTVDLTDLCEWLEARVQHARQIYHTFPAYYPFGERVHVPLVTALQAAIGSLIDVTTSQNFNPDSELWEGLNRFFKDIGKYYFTVEQQKDLKSREAEEYFWKVYQISNDLEAISLLAEVLGARNTLIPPRLLKEELETPTEDEIKAAIEGYAYSGVPMYNRQTGEPIGTIDFESAKIRRGCYPMLVPGYGVVWFEFLGSGGLPFFKRKNENPASSPFILSERMQDALFVKGDKEILFPAEILSKLYHMTRISRQLRIEQHATVGIKDGKAIEIDYVDDPNKIAVVYADLPSSTIMNPYNSEDPKSFYFHAAISTFGKLLSWARDIKEKSDISNPELQTRFSKAVQDIKNTFSFYNSRVNFYSMSRGKRVDIDGQNVVDLSSLSEEGLFNLASDLRNLELIATEWIAPRPLKPVERKEDLEYIDFHSHPIGYACPPSAIRIGEQRIGDIYASGFFKGIVSGLILDTEDGDELFLLYEPDRSNEQKYLDMFDKFWGAGRQSILEDLRRVSMAPLSPSSTNPGNSPASPGKANPGKTKRRTKDELYPAEAVDKRHFEALDDAIVEVDTLRLRRIHARELGKVDKLEAAEKQLKLISRRINRMIDRFPRSIAGYTFRIEAKRLLQKAVSLILAGNEPAAHLTLMAARDRIAKERTALLRDRLRFKPQESIYEDANENIVMRMQRFVSEAGTSILKRKRLAPFPRITRAFRTLDNATDSELKDRNKMEEFLEVLHQCRVIIRTLQQETDIDRAERQTIIQQVINNIIFLAEGLKGVRLTEKKRARKRLSKAGEILEIFSMESDEKQLEESEVKRLLESAEWYLREANSHLMDRLTRAGYIVDSLQRVYVTGARDILQKRISSVLNQIDTISGLLKQSQYSAIKRDWLPDLLDMKYVRLEPGLRWVRFHLREALKVVEQILRESDKSEIERLRNIAEAHLQKAKERMQEVKVIATVMAGYRDLLKDSQLKKIKGLETPDDVFERVYQQNLRNLEGMRGSPTLKRLKLYQACRIPERIDSPVSGERIDNPVHMAVTNLIDEVDAEDFQGKTPAEAKAFIEALCESHKISLDRLTSEAKISLADIRRILTLGEEEYDRAGEVLISLQAAINTLKNRGYKAALGILRAKREKVARDLRAAGLIQESGEISNVIVMLEQIAELTQKERDAKADIERQRLQIDPERQQLARLEEEENSIKERLSNNPVYHEKRIQEAIDTSIEGLTELRKLPEVARRPGIVKVIDYVIGVLSHRDVLKSEARVKHVIERLTPMFGWAFPEGSREGWVKRARTIIGSIVYKALTPALSSIQKRNQIIKEQRLGKRKPTDPIFARYAQECKDLSAELSRLQSQIRLAKQRIKTEERRIGKTEPELEALKAQMRLLFNNAIATLANIEKDLRAKFGLNADSPTGEIETDLLKIMERQSTETGTIPINGARHHLLFEQGA